MSEQLIIARPAPRVPPRRGSLAAAYQAYQRSPRARWHRFLAKIEPWYNWGIASVERMQGMRLVNGYPVAVAEGDVRFFEIQWFGIHLEIQFGRTPKAVR